MPKPPNLEAPVQRVFHSSLVRFDHESAYKSLCPTCKDGILLVRRDNGVLQRNDICVLCGQQVYYLDDKINGEPVAGKTPS